MPQKTVFLKGMTVSGGNGTPATCPDMSPVNISTSGGTFFMIDRFLGEATKFILLYLLGFKFSPIIPTPVAHPN